MPDDARQQPDRRHGKRGGRRSTDVKLDNLATHPHPHVSVAQLADYWARHPETILRWIRKGNLPARRLGGEYLVDVTDALEWESRDPDWVRSRRAS